jgi:hypothetical protein
MKLAISQARYTRQGFSSFSDQDFNFFFFFFLHLMMYMIPLYLLFFLKKKELNDVTTYSHMAPCTTLLNI